MADTRKSLLSQQLENLNFAAGKALSPVGRIPDQISHLVDVGRQKLGILPPIQNYGHAPSSDRAYFADEVSAGSQYDPRTMPSSLGYGKGSIFHGQMVPGSVVAFGSDEKRRGLPPRVSGYRPDPTNKYGGGAGIETLPTELSARDLYSLSRDMAAAKSFGVPQLTSSQMASLFLKEGRDDMGSKGTTEDNPLFQSLTKAGMDYGTASILSQIKEKADTAKRLGISFERAWNGTGTNKYGQTGQDYSDSVKQGRSAINNPKNRQLVALLQSGLDAGVKYPLPRKK